MNYHLKSKPKNTYRLKAISIAVLFFLLVLSAFLFPGGMRTLFYTLSRPVWQVGNGIDNSLFSIGKFFNSQQGLINQNQSLLNQVESLKLKEVDYDMVVKENQELKSLLGRTPSSGQVLARVLSEPPRSPYDTIVIDAGSRDGISKGDRVYTSDRVIIGLVTDITAHTSLVTLFSNPNQKQEAVLERTGASFELSGQGGANLKLDVPKDTDVLWGDTFVYPLLSGAVIGNVYYIDTNSQSAFKTIYVRVPGNVFQSTWLFVEKNMI